MAWTKNLVTSLLKKHLILMLPLLLHGKTEAVKHAPENQQLNGENVAVLNRLSFKSWWVYFCSVFLCNKNNQDC